jgi:hypothetical protein
VENTETLVKLSNEKASKDYTFIHALHNFIRHNHENDDLFDMCDEDEDFVPSHKDATSFHSQLYGQEESDINIVRDNIADGLITIYQYVNNICYVCHNYICIIYEYKTIY